MDKLPFQPGGFDENGIPKLSFIQAFMMTPHGLMPVNLDSIMDNVAPSGYANPPICSIFNGEYEIYLINQITTGNSVKLLLECVENFKYNGYKTTSLLDAYHYLNTTHFLNLLIAKKFGPCTWAYEAVDMQIQILNSDDKYSKIVIMLETSSCSNILADLISKDTYETKTTKMITTIPEIPLMSQVVKTKSYYLPIILYDMAFGFNRSTTLDFDILHLSNFYNIILREYIDDALDTFYPWRRIDKKLMELGDKLIRVQFEVECDEKLLNIRMLCIPSIYASNNMIYKYDYANTAHLIGCRSIDNTSSRYGKELIEFISMISSSEVSQLITISTKDLGIIKNNAEDYHVINSYDILCTLNRFIISDKFNSESNRRVYSNIDEVKSNHSSIYSYWKPLENIIAENDSFVMNIYGFINFNKAELVGAGSPEEWYDVIQDELSEVLNISKDDIMNKKVKLINCYETRSIVRIMIFNIKRPKNKEDNVIPKDNEKPKKKFKLFGGD